MSEMNAPLKAFWPGTGRSRGGGPPEQGLEKTFMEQMLLDQQQSQVVTIDALYDFWMYILYTIVKTKKYG